MNEAIDPLGTAFGAVNRAEVALRDAVRLDLSRVDGPLWMARVPSELRTRWQQSREADEGSSFSRGPEPIEYAEIGELRSLIAHDWDIFALRFGDREAALGMLDEFRSLRNAVMHSGARLTPRECRRAQEVAESVLKKCTAEITNPPPMTTAPPALPQAERRTLTDRQAALYQITVKAMAEMSGKLTGERDAVLRHLRENLADCSPELVAAVVAKFGALPGTRDLTDRLYRDLPPVRPMAPVKRGVADRLKWADTQYMPYRRWMLRTKRQDGEVAQMGLAFEDWLAKAYPSILRDSFDKLVMAAYKSVEQQLKEGARVLWLVIDNLSGLWRWEFQSALLSAGLQLLDSRRMLAMLPSSTSISRRAMLAGRLPVDCRHFPDDEIACRELWRDRGVQQISYCTSFSQVEQAIAGPAPLIVFLYNSLDVLAHTPEQPGFEREEQMMLAMENLALKIAGVLRSMRQAGPARLIVSTDHGSTHPDADGEVVSTPPSATLGTEPEEHRRYVIVSQPAGLNTTDWHILKGADCGLPFTAAVARGQRFVGSKPRAYVHGGLSPEETVVSLIVAGISEREPLRIVLTQATPPLRRGRPGQIAILVRNPFDTAIEDLALSLPEYNIGFDPVEIPARHEVATEERTITLEPDLETQDGVARITCTGRYLLAGQPAVIWEPLQISVSELYRPAMDDFGEMFNA